MNNFNGDYFANFALRKETKQSIEDSEKNLEEYKHDEKFVKLNNNKKNKSKFSNCVEEGKNSNKKLYNYENQQNENENFLINSLDMLKISNKKDKKEESKKKKEEGEGEKKIVINDIQEMKDDEDIELDIKSPLEFQKNTIKKQVEENKNKNLHNIVYNPISVSNSNEQMIDSSIYYNPNYGVNYPPQTNFYPYVPQQPIYYPVINPNPMPIQMGYQPYSGYMVGYQQPQPQNFQFQPQQFLQQFQTSSIEQVHYQNYVPQQQFIPNISYNYTQGYDYNNNYLMNETSNLNIQHKNSSLSQEFTLTQKSQKQSDATNDDEGKKSKSKKQSTSSIKKQKKLSSNNELIVNESVIIPEESLIKLSDLTTLFTNRTSLPTMKNTIEFFKEKCNILVFPKITSNLISLCKHSSANYAIQSLIPYLTNENIKLFYNHVSKVF